FRSKDAAMTDNSAVTGICAEVRVVAARQIGCDPAEIDEHATFFDLGADSLLLVGMTRELEKALGVKIAMRELFSAGDTPWRLATLIAERRGLGAGAATTPTPAAPAPTAPPPPYLPATAPPAPHVAPPVAPVPPPTSYQPPPAPAAPPASTVTPAPPV